MKKAALISLIILYSLSSVGISFKEFYCCGKLKSVSVVLADLQKDQCRHGNSKDECCKFKYQSLKVNDTHFAADQVHAPANFYTDLRIPETPFPTDVLIISEARIINGSHAPPLYRGVPVYIYNCVFRIWFFVVRFFRIKNAILSSGLLLQRA